MNRRKRAKKPVWDLYRDGISYTLISKFVSCRERFRIYSVEGLRVAGGTDSIDFGNAFHGVLERLAKGYTIPQIQAWLFQSSSDPGLKHVVWAVFTEYLETWASDHAQMNYIASEDIFKVPVDLPSGRRLILRGKYDEVFTRNGDLWLQENKTKARIEEMVLDNTLAHNLQTMLYSYTMQGHYGKRPIGVLYNVIRKPQLKQKKNENDLEFANRVIADIRERPEWYFYRWNIEFAPSDIDNFAKRTLFPLLEQICLWWESIKANPFQPWTLPDGSTNPHHFIRPFGIYDPFTNGKGEYFDLITRGTDVGLEIVDTVFPELTESQEQPATTTNESESK